MYYILETSPNININGVNYSEIIYNNPILSHTHNKMIEYSHTYIHAVSERKHGKKSKRKRRIKIIKDVLETKELFDKRSNGKSGEWYYILEDKTIGFGSVKIYKKKIKNWMWPIKYFVNGDVGIECIKIFTIISYVNPICEMSYNTIPVSPPLPTFTSNPFKATHTMNDSKYLNDDSKSKSLKNVPLPLNKVVNDNILSKHTLRPVSERKVKLLPTQRECTTIVDIYDELKRNTNFIQRRDNIRDSFGE